MNLFGRFFGGRSDDVSGGWDGCDSQSLLVNLVDPHGDRLEVHRMLLDAIALAARDAGFRIDSFGEHTIPSGPNTHSILLVGPNAERIFEVIAPTLESVPLPEGSHALKILGDDHDTAKQERVELGWGG